MKDVKIKLKQQISLDEIEKILQEDFGWKRHDPEHPKKHWDYCGISYSLEKDGIVIHMNEKSKKSLGVVERVLNIPSKPEPKFDWFLFEAEAKRAKTMEARMENVERALGIRRKKNIEIIKIHIGKDRITELEREFIDNVLQSVGIRFGYVLLEGSLEVLFYGALAKEWKEQIPSMIRGIWLNDGERIQANFDFDTFDKKLLHKKYFRRMIKKFGLENLWIRKSAMKGYHMKVVGELFTPEQVVKFQKEFDSSPDRAKKNKIKLKAGLRPNFLYDTKYGFPAGNWIPLRKWLKIHKVV